MNGKGLATTLIWIIPDPCPVAAAGYVPVVGDAVLGDVVRTNPVAAGTGDFSNQSAFLGLSLGFFFLPHHSEDFRP